VRTGPFWRRNFPALSRIMLDKGGAMAFEREAACVAAVLAALSLSCSLALAKPIAPHDGCRPVSKVEYNAAKREYLLKSRARVYVRTGPVWRRHYWHCPA
jgi:hypothetical protein